MTRITSTANPTVKALRALSRSKSRNQNGLFLIEGDILLEEALNAGIKIRTVLACEDRADRLADLLNRAKEQGAWLAYATEEVLTRTSTLDTLESVLAIGEIPQKEFCLSSQGKYLVCENLQNPGNIGSIFRSAAAFGVSGVVLAGGCDPYSTKVLRGSMGAVFRLPLFRYPDLRTAADALKCNGIRLYGAVLHRDATPLNRISFSENCAVLIGNEGNGLTEAGIALCDEFVYIPMQTGTESLNAAVAASVILWEMTTER